MDLSFSGATDIGCVRSENQDSIFVPPGPATDGRPTYFVLADGMGGMNGGSIASQTAVEVVRQEMDKYAPSSPLDQAVSESVRLASLAIAEKADAQAALRGMGTTLVVLALDGGKGLVANVGDSRCYLFREGELYQVTEDHSLVAERVRDGSLTPEQARTHHMRNVLTKAVGAIREVLPDLFPIRLRNGDRFLMCSDGLHGPVTDAEMHKVLASAQTEEQQVAKLIEMAKKAGAPDNVSAIVVRVGGLPDRGLGGAEEDTDTENLTTKLPQRGKGAYRSPIVWAAVALLAAFVAAAIYFLGQKP